MRKYIIMGLIAALLGSVASYACYDLYRDYSSQHLQVACSSESCFMVHHAANEMDAA